MIIIPLRKINRRNYNFLLTEKCKLRSIGPVLTSGRGVDIAGNAANKAVNYAAWVRFSLKGIQV